MVAAGDLLLKLKECDSIVAARGALSGDVTPASCPAEKANVPAARFNMLDAPASFHVIVTVCGCIGSGSTNVPLTVALPFSLIVPPLTTRFDGVVLLMVNVAPVFVML